MARNVLILERERHIARLVEVNLEKAGCVVTIADSATDALALAGELQPDLVIVDPSSPGCAQFVEALKSNPTTRGIRVMTLALRP